MRSGVETSPSRLQLGVASATRWLLPPIKPSTEIGPLISHSKVSSRPLASLNHQAPRDTH
jgi:hypothetical protein